jgi:hypothetical protein
LVALVAITGWMLCEISRYPRAAAGGAAGQPIYLTLGLSMMFLFVAGEALCNISPLRALGQRVTFRRAAWILRSWGFYVSSITPSTSGGQPAQMLLYE